MGIKKLCKVNDMCYVINYDEEDNYTFKKVEDYIIEKFSAVDTTKTIAENIEIHKRKIISEYEMTDENMHLEIFENELLKVQEEFDIYIGVESVTEFDYDYEGAMVEAGNYAQLNYIDRDGRRIGESL